MLLYNYSTTYLWCEGDICKLKIIPPHRQQGLKLKLDRKQIVTGKTYKVDEDGETNSGKRLMFDSYGIVFHQYGKDASIDEFELQRAELQKKVDEALTEEDMLEMQKYGSAAFTDPDLREKFANQKRSRAQRDLVDSASAGDRKEKNRNNDLPSLKGLEDFAVRETDGQYLLTMRKYNVGHKMRRVSALVNKINLFVNGSKDRLVIRENRIVVWQGIVGMVFGIFSFLLSLLLGQFSEPDNRVKTRGPGSRMASRTMSSYSSNSAATIPTGRQSNRVQSTRSSNTKAYGGYVPGKSSYSY